MLKKTNGFASPNYTQTPNDLFDLMKDMEDSELRVTMVMVRNTFGFHRPGFKMSIAKLADAAGLSENGAKAGAKAAEERGTFYRVNPESLKEAEWALVIDGSPIDPPAADGSASDPLPGQPVTPKGSTSESQVPSKEKKEIKENGGNPPLSIENAIAVGLPVTEEMLKAQRHKQMLDVANLIGMSGFGINAGAARNIALAFQEARDIVLPSQPAKVKGHRKAVEDMLSQGVKPEHVTRAVKKLVDASLTCTDLYSVIKTAVDIANQPAQAKPVIHKAVEQKTTFKDLPEALQKQILATRNRLKGIVSDDEQPATA